MAAKPLTAAQKRAYAKLTGEPQCAYKLRESIPTLDALVYKGCAVKRHNIGSMFDPRTGITYWRKDLANA